MPIDTTLSVEGQAADAKAVGDAISAIPQSDWDVNDELNPAFIKNRPFYEETAELVYIPYESRTSNPIENNIASYTIADGISEGLKVGKEYKVIIDGLEYVDVAKAGKNWNYLGNADALIDGSFTQESPFGVLVVDANMSMTGTPYAGIAFLTSDGSPTHSFGITTTGTVTKTIDTKYLPEHLQFGETGNTTITTVLPYEEREFYYNAEENGEIAVYTDESFVPFEEGKVYHVTIDGVEYTCQSFCDVDNFGPVVILGSVELLTGGTVPDELPFCSYSATSDDESIFTFGFKSTSGGMHSFGIEVEETEIVKIDKKYLPDDLNKPDVVIFDKGDLISSYENTERYACTCTHTREELLEIYEKLNVNKNQENTPKIIARLITNNHGDVYSFINYSASQRTSNSVQFFFDYTLGGHDCCISAGYAEGSFYWTEMGYDTESKLREKQNKTLIVTAKMGSSSDFFDGTLSGNLTDISHTWQQIEDAIANNAEVKMKVGFTDSDEMFIFTMSDDCRSEGCIIFHTIGENLVIYTTIRQDGSGQWYKEGFATVSHILEKQDKITGTKGQIVGFDENGNAVAQDAPSNNNSDLIVTFDPSGVTTNASTGNISISAFSHTYDEIVEAYNAGKQIVAVWRANNGDPYVVFHLSSIYDNKARFIGDYNNHDRCLLHLTIYNNSDGVTVGSMPYIASYITEFDKMTGATSSKNGTAGLVPAPIAGDQDRFLKGDGTWMALPTEEWVFTLEDGSTVTKKVVLE